MAKEVVFMDIPMRLLPERAMLLPQYRTLVVADWHLGKATHFRREGIFMPLPDGHRDYDRLTSLLAAHPVDTVVLLGDLFHSKLNSEWLTFIAFVQRFPSIRFVLTKGNHDILPEAVFQQAGLEVVDGYYPAPNIVCTHHPPDQVVTGMLHIAGHVHPGCVVKSKGRQRHRLPCFYFHGQLLLLPAFGDLTGMHIVDRLPGSLLFPVVGEEVLAWI